YEVVSLDSQDSSKMTAHLTLQGKYEVIEEGKTIKIDFASSTGHFDAWSGDTQQLNMDLDGSTAEGLTGVITWYGMCTDGSSSGVINLDGKTFEAEVSYE
ncbi:MAG: hypothetical protein J6B04_05375, partial [Clostridia bacterium]|nr:hypothetical protein [Clostridia bacterium]